MASTFFQDYNQNTPITASWLNDVNNDTYTANGTPRTAIQQAAVWVRFSVTAGVVAIQQSSGVSSVTRSSPGVYQVNYTLPMTNAANCYQMSMSAAGFMVPAAETVNSVTIDTTNIANAPFDPTSVGLVVFGAN